MVKFNPVNVTRISDGSNGGLKGQETYKLDNGVQFTVPVGQKFSVKKGDDGQYYFDGLNGATVVGSQGKDKIVFTNTQNTTINISNDNKGGDSVFFGPKTKGNIVVGDGKDMIQDRYGYQKNIQLMPNVFTFKQDGNVER